MGRVNRQAAQSPIGVTWVSDALGADFDVNDEGVVPVHGAPTHYNTPGFDEGSEDDNTEGIPS